MHVEELPMILFTVLAQMSVGAFLMLGLVQVYGKLMDVRGEVTNRVTRMALFAVGPLLVLGFFAAFFHLHDPLHALNTLRHFGSSWLSREITFGVLYGALGFIYTAAEWFGWFGRGVRTCLAALTAIAGVGLVVAMTGVYFYVPTIPAWSSVALWVFFFGSAMLTGPLAVGVALLFAWNSQKNRDAEDSQGTFARLLNTLRVTSKEKLDSETSTFTTRCVQLACSVSALAGALILVAWPVYIMKLGNATDAASKHVADALQATHLVPLRALILVVVLFLVAVVAYRKAKDSDTPDAKLVGVIVLAFVLAFAGELIGRGLHYEGLYHVGLNTGQIGLDYLDFEPTSIQTN